MVFFKKVKQSFFIQIFNIEFDLRLSDQKMNFLFERLFTINFLNNQVFLRRKGSIPPQHEGLLDPLFLYQSLPSSA